MNLVWVDALLGCVLFRLYSLESGLKIMGLSTEGVLYTCSSGALITQILLFARSTFLRSMSNLATSEEGSIERAWGSGDLT